MKSFPPAHRAKSGVSSYPELRKQVEETLLLGQREIEKAKVHTYWRTGKLIDEHINEAKSKDVHYGMKDEQYLNQKLPDEGLALPF